MIRLQRLIPSFLFAVLCLFATAQDTADNRTTAHSLMLGIGRASQLDTYLSPMEYRGPQFTFLRETLRMTRMADSRISHQSLLGGTFSCTDNPAGNANYWGGRIGYKAGWHYHWTPLPSLRLMAGGLLGAQAGVLYNTRNGNNPAQARLGIDLAASVAGIYIIRCRDYPISLRYQADLPLMGCMFSPHYGESYYEISQNGVAHNLLMSHPANAFSLHQMLTADFPVGRTVIRLGYLSDIRHSRVHHLRMNDVSRSFLIGFVRHFSILRKNSLPSNDSVL